MMDMNSNENKEKKLYSDRRWNDIPACKVIGQADIVTTKEEEEAFLKRMEEQF